MRCVNYIYCIWRPATFYSTVFMWKYPHNSCTLVHRYSTEIMEHVVHWWINICVHDQHGRYNFRGDTFHFNFGKQSLLFWFGFHQHLTLLLQIFSASIGLLKGLAPNRGQGTLWTDDDNGLWRKYASQCLIIACINGKYKEASMPA